MHLWVNFLHYPRFKKLVVSTLCVLQPQEQALQESELADKLRRVLKGTAFVVCPVSGTPSISTQPTHSHTVPSNSSLQPLYSSSSFTLNYGYCPGLKMGAIPVRQGLLLLLYCPIMFSTLFQSPLFKSYFIFNWQISTVHIH